MGLEIKKILFMCGILLGFSQFGLAQIELISDGSFELGIPNSQWNEFSTNFGSPLCEPTGCGYGTGTGPHSGSYWAWFGGTSSAEIGQIDQTVTIPRGTAVLRFWLENRVSGGSVNDYLQIQIDDVPISTIIAGNVAFTNYAEVILDVSSYADGNPHKIEFYSVCYGGGVTNFFVDDVSLTWVHAVPVSWIGILSVFIIIGAFVIIRFKRNRSLILNK